MEDRSKDPMGPEDLEILHLDDTLVAIQKPSGLAVHRGWDQGGTYALQLTRDRIGRKVFPVHRLDRPTSGVLLFALSSEAAKQVQQQFQERAVEKHYLALVRGIPPESGTIDHPVPRSKENRERVDAKTDFRRLAVFERYGLVLVEPKTGRSHQIRRHMKHRSWHILGDVQYGKGDHNRMFRNRFGLHRLALHALSLRLNHPVDERVLTFRAPLPDDLRIPLERMGFDESLWAGSEKARSEKARSKNAAPDSG